MKKLLILLMFFSAILAEQLPTAWAANNGTGLTLTQIQGPGDPSGVTNAAALKCTANGGGFSDCEYVVYNNNLTFAAGDYLYVGVWAQPASTAGFANNPSVRMEQVSNVSTVRLLATGPSNGQSGGVSGKIEARWDELLHTLRNKWSMF
jgi:hypothetical protein